MIDPAADLDLENDPARESVDPAPGIENGDPALDRDRKSPSRKSLGAKNELYFWCHFLKNLVTAEFLKKF